MAALAAILSMVEKICNERFGAPDLLARSPGRINLIGEHTDYNMGFVLPAAIDKAIYMAIRKRDDNSIHLFAADLEDTFSAEVNSLQYSEKHWPNYIIGVVDQFQKAGLVIGGFDAVIAGDVPLGAGLSSSAAVECVAAFALDRLFALGLDRREMVLYAQRAENEFVGLQCGIMDQFASMLGKKEKLIRLDCRSLAFDYIPFDTSEIDILLLDTGVKHSLASTEYNLRRQECEEAVRIIKKSYPDVDSLRDATPGMVNECLSQCDSTVYRRSRYVVEEIQRVVDGCADLTAGDLLAFGEKMFATHTGLSELYEVSCPEADALVNMARDDDAVFGARMMGGGFGGCTINIVRKGYSGQLISRIEKQYLQQFSRELKTYFVAIDDGTSLV